MVLVMQSEKRGVKIDPTLELQGLKSSDFSNLLLPLVFYITTYQYEETYW